MKIKKGDKVKVITGHYKGTIGEVLAVIPKENKVIVAEAAVLSEVSFADRSQVMNRNS